MTYDVIILQTDVYGTCTSSYEQRGTSLIKTRNLQKCLSDRISQFWRHSVPLKDGMVSYTFILLLYVATQEVRRFLIIVLIMVELL